MQLPKFSIVIETENLGMAGYEDLKACLDTLQSQDISIEQANEILIMVGGHIGQPTLSDLRNQYPWATVHETGKDLSYCGAKVEGSRNSTGDIVVYVDSDMRYDPSWLRNLLKVFSEHPETDVAAGISRVQIVSGYTMSLNLTWMLPIIRRVDKPEETDNFRLNNFAIKRSTMIDTPIPTTLMLYRSQIPLWWEQLKLKGHKVFLAPHSSGYHAPPDSFMDWFYRMAILGRDYVARGDYLLQSDGTIIEQHSFKRTVRYFFRLVKRKTKRMFSRTRVLLQEDKRNIKHLPAGIAIGFVAIFVMTVAGLITIINRDYIYKKISRYEASAVQ